jgi:hypothetical protein
LTGCATLNDRVVFASMLHVFLAKHEQEETTLLMNRRLHFLQTVLHLPGRVPHILKRYGTFCRNKNAVLLKNKLRRYPQQPQRFIFTNLSEAFW